MNRRDSLKVAGVGIFGFLFGSIFKPDDVYIPNREERKCEVRSNGSWKEVRFENLKKGNVFRLFESDGTIVLNDSGRHSLMFPEHKNDGQNIAMSDPFMKSGVWTIESIPYEKLDNFLKNEGVT